MLKNRKQTAEFLKRLLFKVIKLEVKCIWEHNGNDTLLFAEDFPGAFTRGISLELAAAKMPDEIKAYLRWCGKRGCDFFVTVTEDKPSSLDICDADTEVIFASEKTAIDLAYYTYLKNLALKSAQDFQILYDSIPDKNIPLTAARKTFYGDVPTTADEMYNHTKGVNDYYFGEIGVKTDNTGSIYECRKRGFDKLEEEFNYLENLVFCGSYDELWSLKKVMRRFIWHDRIHAKAMLRGAQTVFENEFVADPFKLYAGK